MALGGRISKESLSHFRRGEKNAKNNASPWSPVPRSRLANSAGGAEVFAFLFGLRDFSRWCGISHHRRTERTAEAPSIGIKRACGFSVFTAAARVSSNSEKPRVCMSGLQSFLKLELEHAGCRVVVAA